MIRLVVEGDAALWSPLVPWAKRKHRALARAFGGVRNWAWRREINGAIVILERQGQIDRVTIKVGTLVGYEFGTAYYEIHPTISYATRLNGAKFTVVRAKVDEFGDAYLAGLNNRGKTINLDVDGFDQQNDAFLYGRQWANYFNAGRYAISPLVDWFEIPIATPAQVAEWAASGYQGCRRILSSVAHRRRHQDQSNKTLTGGLIDQYFVGPPVKHRIGKKSSSLPIYMTQVTPPTPGSAGSSLVGSGAMQGQYVITGSHRADDYKFSVFDDSVDLEYGITVTPPAWVGGNVWTRWYWRGDGQRSIALQYGWNPSTKILDSGIHELDWSVTAGNGGPIVVTNTTFSVHNLATKPMAIDYDLFDQAKRNIIVMEPWVSPPYVGLDDDSVETYVRAVLIYAAFCTVSDSGVISAPYRRIPMWHGPWVLGEDDPGGALLDENGKSIIGDAAANAAFRTQWSYDWVRGKVAATDMRADAFACWHQVERHSLSGPIREYGKRWLIWGAWREKTWCDSSAVPLAPAPDTVDALTSPPAGYVRLEPGHPLWDTRLVNGADLTIGVNFTLHILYSHIEDYWATLLTGPDGTRLRVGYQFNGFRINPKKHFALYAHMPRDFFYDPYIQMTDGVLGFLNLDHIERFNLDEIGDPAPLVSTHYDVFNAARATAYAPGDWGLGHTCFQGIWVE